LGPILSLQGIKVLPLNWVETTGQVNSLNILNVFGANTFTSWLFNGESFLFPKRRAQHFGEMFQGARVAGIL